MLSSAHPDSVTRVEVQDPAKNKNEWPPACRLSTFGVGETRDKTKKKGESDVRRLVYLATVIFTPVTSPLLATAKRVNRVTNRVMSPGTIVNRTSRRIDRFRAGRPRIKIYLLQCWKGLSNRRRLHGSMILRLP